MKNFVVMLANWLSACTAIAVISGTAVAFLFQIFPRLTASNGSKLPPGGGITPSASCDEVDEILSQLLSGSIIPLPLASYTSVIDFHTDTLPLSAAPGE